MRSTTIKILFSILIQIFCISSFAQVAQPEAQPAGDGVVYIKIGEAKLKKSLMALPPLMQLSTAVAGKNVKTVGTDLYNTILNDLDVSSYFQFIKSEAFLEDPAKVGLRPAPGEPNGFKFENWKQIGAEFLIRAGYSVIGEKVELETYVYFVTQAKLVMGKKYSASLDEVRKLAHTFCNDVIEKLTGKKGMFLSKFVVASDHGSIGANRWKEIFTMDWDGHDLNKITSHKTIALSPSWSPNGKTVAYTAVAMHENIKTRNWDLFTYELDTKKRYLISSRKGINSGAAYMPDGKNLLVTVSQSGNPDIFKMTEDGDGITRLTNGPTGAMNVEPAVSSDGKSIAFSSDRSGRPMIYVMNVDGSNVRRVTYAGKYNSSPSFSPDGKKIAFAGYDKDHFDLFIMDSTGTNLERLTSERKIGGGKFADNEDPSFSPDGRHVVFTSNRTGNNQIYIINIDGTGERRITVDKANYFRPKWSNNID